MFYFTQAKKNLHIGKICLIFAANKIKTIYGIMKKSVFFIMILGAIAIAMGAQGQVTYTVTFSSNDLSFESVSASDGNTYSQVLLSGVTGNTTEAGKPKLPLRTLHLMIPFGKKSH